LNISVIGLGFVGLTAALGFADKGFNVYGFDIDSNRTIEIKKGIIPFFEPGLNEALNRTLYKNFSITSTVKEAVKDADIVFFCVGTPCGDDGKADLKYLLSAIDSIINDVPETCIFILKSTVPPGTTQNIIQKYVKDKRNTLLVANNPEFLREGYCWDDFMKPDRIVCGCNENDISVISALRSLYTPFNAPIHFVSLNTAEFIKYLSNSLLASLISFSNEMALIADAAGDINIAKAFKILHQDKRINGSGIRHYIYPGCGYGGYCLPKDTAALSANAKANDYLPDILNSVISLNYKMPSLTAEKIKQKVGDKNKKIGILGLSFKPNSDDVRDSPAAKIISILLEDEYKNIYAYDPEAINNFKQVYKININYSISKEDVCDTCDSIAIITTWSEFKDIDKIFPNKQFIDCRYFLD